MRVRTKTLKSIAIKTKTAIASVGVLAIVAISHAYATPDANTRSYGQASTQVADLFDSATLHRFVHEKNPKPAPDTVFFDGEGSEKTLADYRGKVVVLNFWATWCVPCVKEMPTLDRLEAQMAPEGITVLPVSVDFKPERLVPKFYEKNNLKNLPVLFDRNQKLYRAFKVRGLPTTIVIDPDGRVVGSVQGEIDWTSDEIKDVLRSFTEEEAKKDQTAVRLNDVKGR